MLERARMSCRFQLKMFRHHLSWPWCFFRFVPISRRKTQRHKTQQTLGFPLWEEPSRKNLWEMGKGGGGAETPGLLLGQNLDLSVPLGISQILTKRGNFVLCFTFLAARDGWALTLCRGEGEKIQLKENSSQGPLSSRSPWDVLIPLSLHLAWCILIFLLKIPRFALCFNSSQSAPCLVHPYFPAPDSKVCPGSGPKLLG